jgi:hypothetical protein
VKITINPNTKFVNQKIVNMSAVFLRSIDKCFASLSLRMFTLKLAHISFYLLTNLSLFPPTPPKKVMLCELGFVGFWDCRIIGRSKWDVLKLPVESGA